MVYVSPVQDGWLENPIPDINPSFLSSSIHYPTFLILKQEGLGRSYRLLSFDTTRTA
jgi:hypothetical protein